MKVRVSSLIHLGLLIVLMLDVGLQNLPFFKVFYFGYAVQIQALICVLLAIVCLTTNSIKSIISPYLKKINKITLLIFFFFVIEIFYTTRYTELSLDQTFTNFLPYLKLLLVYPMIYLLNVKGDKKIKNSIICVALIYLIYSGFIAVIYNMTNVNLDSTIIRNDNLQRFGFVRLGSISLSWIALLFLFQSALYSPKKNTRTYSYVLSAFVFLYIFLINQGRAGYLAVIFMLVTMLIFKERRSANQIAIFLLLGIAVIGFISSGVVDSFIETLIPGYSGDFTGDTVTTRIIQLETFKKMVQKMPLGYFGGLGLRYTLPSVTTWGQAVDYYFLDTGLIGDFYNLGVLAIVLFLSILIPAAKFAFQNRHFRGEAYSFAVGVLAVIIVGSMGWSILPYARIITVPMIWAFIAYYKYRPTEGVVVEA